MPQNYIPIDKKEIEKKLNEEQKNQPFGFDASPSDSNNNHPEDNTDQTTSLRSQIFTKLNVFLTIILILLLIYLFFLINKYLQKRTGQRGQNVQTQKATSLLPTQNTQSQAQLNKTQNTNKPTVQGETTSYNQEFFASLSPKSTDNPEFVQAEFEGEVAGFEISNGQIHIRLKSKDGGEFILVYNINLPSTLQKNTLRFDELIPGDNVKIQESTDITKPYPSGIKDVTIIKL